jgi:hypothetical protein
VVNTVLSRILCLALLSFCCRAQTVSPLTIIADSILPCQGNTITYRVAQQAQLSNFKWQVLPQRGYTSGNANSPTLQVNYTQALTYTVSVTAFDSVQHQGSIVTTISRSATATFNASLVTQGFPNELFLTNYSANFKNLRWLFSEGGSDSSDFVKRAYSASGAHKVLLVAYGQNGCNDTSDYDFYINDSSGVILPNIFTPNNDGVNDVYRPIARGILHLSGRVFSRDRIMLYKWDTVNGFWDGYTTSGMPCTDGVYFVVVDAIGFDNKKYSLSTYVQLMR